MGKQDLTPVLLLTISLVSQFLPSLINNPLNLATVAQGRSWRLSEGCFLWSEKEETQKPWAQELHRAMHGSMYSYAPIDCFLFAKTSIIVLNSSGWERLLSSWKYLHLCMQACPLNWDRLFETLRTAAHQASLSMELSRLFQLIVDVDFLKSCFCI